MDERERNKRLIDILRCGEDGSRNTKLEEESIAIIRDRIAIEEENLYNLLKNTAINKGVVASDLNKLKSNSGDSFVFNESIVFISATNKGRKNRKISSVQDVVDSSMLEDIMMQRRIKEEAGVKGEDLARHINKLHDDNKKTELAYFCPSCHLWILGEPTIIRSSKKVSCICSLCDHDITWM